MGVVAIVNLNSGALARRGAWDRLAAELRAAIGPFDARFTQGVRDAEALTRAALVEGAERVVAVGGDGTLGEAVTGFFRDGSPLNPEAVFSFVMSGTGNDFQKTLGRPTGLTAAVAALANPRERRIDVGRIAYVAADGRPDARCFLNVASFGMSGEVDRRVGRVPWRGALGGKASFFLATASALAAYRNKAVRVAADGAVVYEGRARLAVIGNGRFAGGGMMVAPTAELDDGLLDLVVLPDVGVGEVIRHIAKIYQGSHLSVDKVLHRRARRIEAFSEEETLLDVDGEAPGRLPASFEVMPRALRLAY